MNRIHWLLLFALFPALSVAQRTPVSGRVVAGDRLTPLPGVSVRDAGGSGGTTSDGDGRFELVLSGSGTHRLQFSSVGFDPQTIDLKIDTLRTGLTVQLRPSLVQLNDLLVVTAQRYATPAFDRPEALTVVSTRNLAEDGLRSTPEVLSGRSGVFVQKTTHGGGSPFVRGLTGQQTLLLVDGIRLNNATFRSGPNQYLNTIDPFLLDRVEVMRGGGSVPYGSDALGGTVNVLTRTPHLTDRTEFHGTALAKATSGGMERSGRLALGVSGPKAAVLGGLSYRDFGDLVGGRGIGRQRPTCYDQLSLDLKSVARLGPRLRLTVAAQHLRQDSVPVFHKINLENYAVHQFDPQARTLAYARLEGHAPSRWLASWQVTPLLNRTREGRQLSKVDETTTLVENDEVRTYGLVASVRSRPAAAWTVLSGVEGYFDRVNSRRQRFPPAFSSAGPGPVERGLYPDGATMRNLAVYSLHNVELGRWTATAGARYNAFTIKVPDADVGLTTLTPSALVGNAGVSFALLPELRATGSVSRSFRAPNIDDLGTLGIVDFRYEVPNARLRPERGLNKEVGIKLKTTPLSASVVAYHNRLSDLIDRTRTGETRDGYPVYVKENTASAVIRGLEADAEWQLGPRWLASGFINYTYGTNLSKNEPFRRIPPLNGRLALRRSFRGRGWARLEWLGAARQDRLAGGDIDDNRIPPGGTPGWNVLHAAAGYRWNRLSVSAEAQNLFNEAYRTHGSGVSGVGRSVWAMLRYDW